MRPEMRDIIKKLPKKRGYRFKTIETKPITVNLDVLEKNFTSGETVSPKALVEKKIISKGGRAFPVVKILSNGNLTKKLNFTGCVFSEKAREKISKAGGTTA
jgi:large subunit ribosomal protein L15